MATSLRSPAARDRPTYPVLAEMADDIANGRRSAGETESRWIAEAFLFFRDEQLFDARRATAAEAALKSLQLEVEQLKTDAFFASAQGPSSQQSLSAEYVLGARSGS